MPSKKKFWCVPSGDIFSPLSEETKPLNICPQSSLPAAQSSGMAQGNLRALPLDFGWLQRGKEQRQTVVPVFLPFRGCPVRCVFCAQDVQTGLGDCQRPEGGDQEQTADVHSLLLTARKNLRVLYEDGRPADELAFYGGTFTALPEDDLTACLNLAREAQQQGWIRSFRCSTRPDRVDAAVLERLSAAGCGVIELGVQSFADSALAASRRGYDGDAARAACAQVRAAGLKLVVQLLPGMPGHRPEDFRDDVPQALAAGAAMLRFYPCLVLEGTGLAAMWREGRYAPWSLEATLEALALGWLMAARAGVPVIRMGLAPEPGLNEAVLAGPVDNELGGRVRGRALLLAVKDALAGAAHPSASSHAPTSAPLFDLHLPRSVQGFFWGASGELRERWSALGLRSVFFHHKAEAQIVFVENP